MIKHKNYGKSVRTRLLTLMNKTGYRYMYLLTRYFNERLLYRVSVSQYKDNFLLNSVFPVAAVKLFGYSSVLGGVFG